MLRGDTGAPFNPPGGSTLAAGDIVIELQRRDKGAQIGNRLQVQIGYNGTARITFGRPIGALQGVAQ